MCLYYYYYKKGQYTVNSTLGFIFEVLDCIDHKLNVNFKCTDLRADDYTTNMFNKLHYFSELYIHFVIDLILFYFNTPFSA